METLLWIRETAAVPPTLEYSSLTRFALPLFLMSDM